MRVQWTYSGNPCSKSLQCIRGDFLGGSKINKSNDQRVNFCAGNFRSPSRDFEPLPRLNIYHNVGIGNCERNPQN
jgi:hypothetical protein